MFYPHEHEAVPCDLYLCSLHCISARCLVQYTDAAFGAGGPVRWNRAGIRIESNVSIAVYPSIPSMMPSICEKTQQSIEEQRSGNHGNAPDVHFTNPSPWIQKEPIRVSWTLVTVVKSIHRDLK